jgi:hypothetical protein
MTDTVLESGLIVPRSAGPYPPPVPPDTRVNTTPQVNNHPSDHNMLADGLQTLINTMGTTPAGAFSDMSARFAALEPGPGFWWGSVAGPFTLTATPTNFTIFTAAGMPAGYYLILAQGSMNIGGTSPNIYAGQFTPMVDSGLTTLRQADVSFPANTEVPVFNMGRINLGAGSHTFQANSWCGATGGTAPTLVDVNYAAIILNAKN